MRGVLVDANLLCLLVVGRSDPASIPTHPRLRVFDHDDFITLIAVLDRLGDPVLCPHVLAETANLLAYRQAPAQQVRWRSSLAELVAMSTEDTEPAIRIVDDAHYLRLGLTDALLLLLAADKRYSLVSDDLQLCIEAERRALSVVNYNHLRDGALRIEQL